MRIKATGLCAASYLVSGLKLRKRRPALVVFTYHQVTPSFDPALHALGTWTGTEQFRTELRRIRRKFPVVSLVDGIMALESGTLDDVTVAITMDDGDRSVADHALPILREADCPVTLFINSAFVQSTAIPWVYLLREWAARGFKPSSAGVPGDSADEVMRLLLSTRDPATYARTTAALAPHLQRAGSPLFVDETFLRGLDPTKVHLGLHGHRHERFSLLPAAEQAAELDANLAWVSRFPAYRPLFAVPFGAARDWNQDTARLCLERGLRLVLSDGGIARIGDVAIRRIPADGRNTLTAFHVANADL
jgi:peptidoglycan/xylan/chitin deacetylase (PgdA/CDA1 family)